MGLHYNCGVIKNDKWICYREHAFKGTFELRLVMVMVSQVAIWREKLK